MKLKYRLGQKVSHLIRDGYSVDAFSDGPDVYVTIVSDEITPHKMNAFMRGTIVYGVHFVNGRVPILCFRFGQSSHWVVSVPFVSGKAIGARGYEDYTESGFMALLYIDRASEILTGIRIIKIPDKLAREIKSALFVQKMVDNPMDFLEELNQFFDGRGNLEIFESLATTYLKKGIAADEGDQA
ncbi:MAG: hypothetical protein D6677_01575 [Calditrichaeota bacterium]|nr:MAG: hypothetical protein D6677_01575 [Calditrichota bacterium]